MACDNDVDGVAALRCGGTDCYDDDPTISDCWQQVMQDNLIAAVSRAPIPSCAGAMIHMASRVHPKAPLPWWTPVTHSCGVDATEGRFVGAMTPMAR